jgi:replicative DNA helicase
MGTRDVLLRVPPQAIEAEQSVLGAVLLDNGALEKALDILRAEDFYREGHRTLFGGMRELAAKGEPIDAITICDWLRSRGELEAIGGAAYIAELAACVPTAVNVAHYARIVREKSLAREMASVATRIAGEAYDAPYGIEDHLIEWAAQVTAVAYQRVRAPEPSLARASMQLIDAAASGALRRALVPTGFAKLDAMIGGGFHRGDLVIVAGRTSKGKSALALDMVVRTGGGAGSLYLSNEMYREQLIQRALASIGSLPWLEIQQRGLRDEEKEAALAAWNRFAAMKVEILYRPGLTHQDVRREAHQVLPQWDGGMDRIVVDQLQLMEVREAESERNRNLELGKITRELKKLAGELDCVVIALSQLSREGDERPLLRHLRDSGSIEQDADTVVFIYDGAEASEKIIEVAKARGGGTMGCIYLQWERQFTRFGEGL